jgi:hypothetical protein
VIKNEGETYRLSLQWLAHEKGVEGNVIFYNRFVSPDELIQFISATDIYITPYLDAAQITSGTLAYTVGAGKAVISTPYWYAEEMLAEERGALVPFSDPQALADQVVDLLGNESKRHAMRKRAYLFGRDMIWRRWHSVTCRALNAPAPNTILLQPPTSRSSHWTNAPGNYPRSNWTTCMTSPMRPAFCNMPFSRSPTIAKGIQRTITPAP